MSRRFSQAPIPTAVFGNNRPANGQHECYQATHEVCYPEAASLGCRFITAFHGLVEQALARPGDWLAVHGCSGVGLSAIMLAAIMGVNVVAVDIDNETLAMASRITAVATINKGHSPDIPQEIMDLTNSGAQASNDALGSTGTCQNFNLCLRAMGRHVKVGLMKNSQKHPEIPIGVGVSGEIDIRGSSGMSPKPHPAIFNMIESDVVAPKTPIDRELSLEEGADLLTRMDQFPRTVFAVIASCCLRRPTQLSNPPATPSGRGNGR